MSNTDRPIGVFDSGCGGLTVLRVLHRYFPHENFIYYADTANLPYGTKSPAEIKKHTHAALTWLQDSAKTKLIVVACHTSSAVALDAIQHDFRIPIIGTIYPLASYIMNNNQSKKIGIIATPTSAVSRMHEKALYAQGFTGIIESIACPTFVPLIEQQEQDTITLTINARKYLEPFYTHSLDTLVYGCTHYPLIASIIEPLLPSSLQYIDPAYAIADTVAMIINRSYIHPITNSYTGKTEYYCSENAQLFSLKVAHIMQAHAPVSLINTISTT